MATTRVAASTTRIDCPNCARTAEEEIKRINGVNGARIDFLNSRIHYSFDEETIEDLALRKRIEGLGHFKFREDDPAAKKSLPFSRELLILIAVALGLTLLGVAAEHLLHYRTIGRVLIYSAIGVGGWDIIKRAAIGARHRRIDMNTLMTLAVIGAVVIGKLDEAVAVVLLFGAANLLESFSLWKFSRNLTDLHDFTSAQALLKQGDSVLAVTPESLQPEDVVIVREGMKIPADGVVVSGQSSVDVSSLTGEARPEAAKPGSEVYAGTVNLEGYLEIKVTAAVSDSRVGRILRMVTEVSERKARLERLIDKFARYYTPIVVGLAAAVAVLPPLVYDGAFAVWFYRALVFLVIACPCALVISTPVAVTAALAAASRKQAIMKGGDAVERLAQARIIAFDKTGTLTTGALELSRVESLDGIPEAELLKLAGSLEKISNHPAARAVMSASVARGLGGMPVDGLRSVTGFGVEGRIGGKMYRFGGIEFLAENDRAAQPHNECAFLLCDGKLLARFHFEDQLRTEARDTIDQLRGLQFSRIGVLSGDRREIVQAMARKLGLDFAHGQLLPDQKYSELRALGEHVAMVGDGINDTVALSGSDVAIAIGKLGNDMATQPADVVLFGGDIKSLPWIFQLGRRTVTLIKMNIAFAFGIKIAFLGLAAAGYATMWMAVAADMGTSLLVILNSLRLMRE